MATDGAPARSNRPRPLLLVLLGIVVVAFLLMQLGGSTGSGRQPSNPRAPQHQQTATGQHPDAKVDPSALDVQLEALSGERPGPGETERNPFRFKPKPPPPAPPPARGGGEKEPPPPPSGPPPPPAPPPITVKYIGTIDLPDGTTVAAFTDCSVGRTVAHAREGGIIMGQYRLVKIGLQSVVVEHLDGRGRTTLPKGGQECVK